MKSNQALSCNDQITNRIITISNKNFLKYENPNIIKNDFELKQWREIAIDFMHPIVSSFFNYI